MSEQPTSVQGQLWEAVIAVIRDTAPLGIAASSIDLFKSQDDNEHINPGLPAILFQPLPERFVATDGDNARDSIVYRGRIRIMVAGVANVDGSDAREDLQTIAYLRELIRVLFVHKRLEITAGVQLPSVYNCTWTPEDVILETKWHNQRINESRFILEFYSLESRDPPLTQ